MTSEIDDRDAARNLAWAVNRLEPRVKTHNVRRHLEAGLQIVVGPITLSAAMRLRRFVAFNMAAGLP
jgi:hypothetical protein